MRNSIDREGEGRAKAASHTRHKKGRSQTAVSLLSKKLAFPNSCRQLQIWFNLYKNKRKHVTVANPLALRRAGWGYVRVCAGGRGLSTNEEQKAQTRCGYEKVGRSV